ncbi:MAG: hypothetical protein RDV48_27355 [Candidatus Eremiobacteraeota bacterium]|nr:hypothetical protein [Candidatus Eremiobacteraeota bacterium]
MADLHIQPATSYTGAYGGSGTYAGFAGINSSGTAGAKGGVAQGTGPNGGSFAGGGAAAVGPNGAAAAGKFYGVSANGNAISAQGSIGANQSGAAGKGYVGVDSANIYGGAGGQFAYDAATGNLDACGEAKWCNKSTGEYHEAAAYADLTKGQGGTIYTEKDGVAKTYTVPPRPTA